MKEPIFMLHKNKLTEDNCDKQQNFKKVCNFNLSAVFKKYICSLKQQFLM